MAKQCFMLRAMKLIEFLGAERGRAVVVAAATNLTAAFISQIANGVRPCPAERGAALERACNGEVRRWELRPDDWHRIWPELIGTEGAPAVPATVAEARDAA